MKTKIVFLDLDNTLITTKTGRTFPINHNDWKPIPKTLKFIKNKKSQGYKIILVTNQGGISKGFLTLENFNTKLKDIQDVIGFKFDKIFIALSMDSDYRKPKTYKLLEDLKKLDWIPDLTKSIMIGDAGGEPSDFSDSDKVFAENLGITFIHVDEIPLN